MVTEKDLAMSNDLKQTLDEVKEETAGNNDAVYYSEDPNAYSLDCIYFESITAQIMEQTEDLFALTRTCDRLSPEYLLLCKNLVKAVDYLGSAFITKVALIELEKPVDGIETLTADLLYQMISYNFRKVNDALNTVKQTQKRFDLKLYNWLLIFGKVLELCRIKHFM